MFLVYFAGELFSSKHLVGNAALADAIAKVSNLSFACVLPQTLETGEMSAQDIRDKDIVTLIGCDLALFNFDGPELDSGTVTEFMFAKFADIPSLLLRAACAREGGRPHRRQAIQASQVREQHWSGRSSLDPPRRPRRNRPA